MMTKQLASSIDYAAQASDIIVLQEEIAKGSIEHFTLSIEDREKARMIAVENVKTWRDKSEMSAEIIDSILSYLKLRGIIQ
jgi:hypothetical protein